VSGFAIDPCEQCEEMLQPFLDRDLNEEERALAEEHLNLCAYCRKRYRFEADLRRFVRQAVTEEMPPDLKTRLANLRTPLL
jgi:anti-sigma factor (TIGR02949 family)